MQDFFFFLSGTWQHQFDGLFVQNSLKHNFDKPITCNPGKSLILNILMDKVNIYCCSIPIVMSKISGWLNKTLRVGWRYVPGDKLTLVFKICSARWFFQRKPYICLSFFNDGKPGFGRVFFIKESYLAYILRFILQCKSDCQPIFLKKQGIYLLYA